MTPAQSIIFLAPTAAVRDRDEFLSVAAHELKTPVTALRGFAQLFLRYQRDGVAIGSHTVTHADLPALSDRRAFAELAGSRRLLEQRLGHPVQWLAYPDGKEDARIVSLARSAGYLLAVTTKPGSDQHANDPLRLHRYEILGNTNLTTLAAYTR